MIDEAVSEWFGCDEVPIDGEGVVISSESPSQSKEVCDVVPCRFAIFHFSLAVLHGTTYVQ